MEKISFRPKSRAWAPPDAEAALAVVLDFCKQLPTDLPCCVFLEAPVIGRGGAKATLVQSFASGAVQAGFCWADCTVQLVNNKTWKAKALGNGNATKPQIARALEHRWPKAFHAADGDEDLLDSAGLNIYGRAITGM